MPTDTLDFPTATETVQAEPAPVEQVANELPPANQFTKQLRKETAGVRLSVKRFGTRRALTEDQTAVAAEQFHAQPDSISAKKALIDTTFGPYRAVSQVISQARAYWLTMSVPYPLSGIRLIRKSLIDTFDETMKKFQAELDEALKQLEENYAEMRTAAEARLGDLFNPGDYPESIKGSFALAWDYPSVEPPDYLRQLNPKLYEQEQQRIQSRFDEAVKLAEEAFAGELQKLVTHLLDRLQPGEDGKQKTFKKAAVENLTEFFSRFRQMGIHSNAQLDAAVAQAEAVLKGANADALRKDTSARQSLAENLAQVATALETMVVEKPARAISLEDV